MKNNLLVKFQEAFNPVLPDVGGLKDYLDYIVPYVSDWGEDLIETEFYTEDGGKPWLEFRDQVNFQETVVHFFNPDNEYLRSTNGNILKGEWRILENTNKMIIETFPGGDRKKAIGELYELVYLDKTFFILQKHGDEKKYLAMGYEPLVRGMTWLEYIQALFWTYRNRHKKFILTVVVIAILVIFFTIFSILR